MENYTNRLDAELKEIVHYQNYPCLLPFIGQDYEKQSKRLLLIGESHYLPEDTNIDLSQWYNLDEDSLSEEDLEYVHTRGVLNYAINKNYPAKGHAIYKNIEEAFIEIGLNPTDKSNLFKKVAFYNFFQRPAEETGGSINFSEIDMIKAKEVYHHILNILKPTHVIFVSKKVWDSIPEDESEEMMYNYEDEIQFDFSPHPASAHWNMEAKAYGGITGKKRFQKFLTENEINLN